MSSAAPLVLVARIVASPGHTAEMEAALRSLISPTRLKTGCELYVLHRDLDDPEAFVMLERWRSEPDWLAHMATRHVAEFRAMTADRLAAFHVTRLMETE